MAIDVDSAILAILKGSTSDVALAEAGQKYFHSVFLHDKGGKVSHYMDLDSHAEAVDTMRYLRADGEKPFKLVVAQSDAKWNKPGHVQSYVAKHKTASAYSDTAWNEFEEATQKNYHSVFTHLNGEVTNMTNTHDLLVHHHGASYAPVPFKQKGDPSRHTATFQYTLQHQDDDKSLHVTTRGMSGDYWSAHESYTDRSGKIHVGNKVDGVGSPALHGRIKDWKSTTGKPDWTTAPSTTGRPNLVAKLSKALRIG